MKSRIFYRVAPSGMRIGFFSIIKILGDIVCLKYVRNMSQLFDNAYSYDFNSGKAALYVGLKSLSKIKKSKREVVVPAYTCFSVAAAIELIVLISTYLPNTKETPAPGLQPL